MTTTMDPDTNDTVVNIPTDQIRPAPNNVRRKADPKEGGLEASIKSIGIQVPLLVRPVEEVDGTCYELVAGERRWRAARNLERQTVPAIVRPLTDQQRLIMMLVENLQRSDIDPVEEATGYFRLVETGMTQAEMAEKVGRSKKHVADRIKMLGAGADILAKVKTGDATIEDALAFSKITDEEIRALAVERFTRKGDADWAIQRANDEVVKARKRAKAVEAATKKGYEIYDAPSAWNNVPAKHKALDDLGLHPGDATKHDVRVVASITPEGKMLLVTPDVAKARKAVGGTATDEEKEAKEREKEAKRKQREADQLRDAKLGVLARERANATDLLTEAAAYIRTNIGSDRAMAIARLLDLEPVARQGATNWLATIEPVSDKALVRAAYLVDLRSRAAWQSEAKKELAALIKDVPAPEAAE